VKIVLGTAQFGLDYGVANQQGQIQKSKARDILNYAKENGISVLDTAIAYGESEQVLGELGVSEWDIITKIPLIKENRQNYFLSLKETLRSSLQRLNVSNLYGVLLHSPKQLLSTDGERIYRALEEIKTEGLIKKIGISIYDPVDLDILCANFDFDIVQAPFNIMDRRIINSNWNKKLAEKNIELHVRSIFLQGLLLLPPDKRPNKFSQWSSLWSKWDAWISENNLTPLQSCLHFAMSNLSINKIVVGIDSCAQLKEILESISGEFPEPPDDLQSDDLTLINPFNWPE